MANSTSGGVPAKATKRAPRAKAPAPAKRAPRQAAPPPPPAPEVLPAPGWYVDPADDTVQRYWDGQGYVGHPLPAGIDVSGLAPEHGLNLAAAQAARADADAAQASAPAKTIVFQGRTMAVLRPNGEQVAIWDMLANQMQTYYDAEQQRVAANLVEPEATRKKRLERERKMVQRAMKIISTVLAGEDDRDWLTDQFIDGTLTLDKAAAIPTLAVAAFAAAATTDAPTTGPTPRARRRS